MDYFAAMRAFVRAVELGRFSKAAAEAGVKVSTVSRYITALEGDLGAAVFNRSTRRLHLTEVGVAFYENASRIITDVGEARLAAMSLNARPQGLLKITVPGAFGRLHIIPHLPLFLGEHPDIRIEATLTDEATDLIGSGADFAVRIGALSDSSLITKRLFSEDHRLVASQAYLARAAVLQRPSDLQGHACLATTQPARPIWSFAQDGADEAKPLDVEVGGPLRCNDPGAILKAALAGLGVALLPTWLAAEEVRSNRLVEALPAWNASPSLGAGHAIWGLYAPKKIVSPKVRAFMSFLERLHGSAPQWAPQAAS